MVLWFKYFRKCDLEMYQLYLWQFDCIDWFQESRKDFNLTTKGSNRAIFFQSPKIQIFTKIRSLKLQNFLWIAHINWRKKRLVLDGHGFSLKGNWKSYTIIYFTVKRVYSRNLQHFDFWNQADLDYGTLNPNKYTFTCKCVNFVELHLVCSGLWYFSVLYVIWTPWFARKNSRWFELVVWKSWIWLKTLSS